MSEQSSYLRNRLRFSRGFVAQEVLFAKIGRLDKWFTVNRLDSAVVGLSGGVDSAVVLGLLLRIESLRRVVALSLPIAGMGASNQDVASQRAAMVARQFGAELWTVPLGDMHAHMLAGVSRAAGLVWDEWSAGQVASVERTPVLYGAAALLQAHGHRSVVVGTTNRDEGAYLGFFGKASDAMVDLQPISDLHKSEVVALAELLGVPTEVRSAPPTGDVWDGRTDAELIGATYDEIETALRLMELGRPRRNDAIERMHEHNAHKYRVGSPAVHLDVMPRGVPGGWSDEPLSGRSERTPSAVPGLWTLPPLTFDPIDPGLPVVEVLECATKVHHVLTGTDCEMLIDAFAQAPAEPVGVSGYTHDTRVGSYRATAFSAELAQALWHRMRPAVASVRFLGPFDAADGLGHVTWRVVGLSPLLRFMRYERGGRHICHYDAGFDYGDGRRTLVSVVFYLTDAGDGDGGATRFIADGQAHLPVAHRSHADWDRAVEACEVRQRVVPQRGSVLLFDHRHADDVETWNGASPRIVIRGDVVYEAVPDGRSYR